MESLRWNKISIIIVILILFLRFKVSQEQPYLMQTSKMIKNIKS